MTNGTYTIINTLTGEVYAHTAWYIPSGPADRQRKALAKAKADALCERKARLEKEFAAKGKMVEKVWIEGRDNGRFMIEETGERFAILCKTYIPTLNDTEHYDSWQRNGRGEWVGPHSR